MMESPVGTTYELRSHKKRCGSWCHDRPETCTDDWIIVGGACALSDPTISSSRTVQRTDVQRINMSLSLSYTIMHPHDFIQQCLSPK